MAACTSFVFEHRTLCSQLCQTLINWFAQSLFFMDTFLGVIPQERNSVIELIGTNISTYKPNISVYLTLPTSIANNV